MKSFGICTAAVVLWFACGVLAMGGLYARALNYDLGCGDLSRRVELWKFAPFIFGGPLSLFVAAANTGGFVYGISFKLHDDWCGEPGDYVDRCWFDAAKPENREWCSAMQAIVREREEQRRAERNAR